MNQLVRENRTATQKHRDEKWEAWLANLRVAVRIKKKTRIPPLTGTTARRTVIHKRAKHYQTPSKKTVDTSIDIVQVMHVNRYLQIYFSGNQDKVHETSEVTTEDLGRILRKLPANKAPGILEPAEPTPTLPTTGGTRLQCSHAIAVSLANGCMLSLSPPQSQEWTGRNQCSQRFSRSYYWQNYRYT